MFLGDILWRRRIYDNKMNIASEIEGATISHCWTTEYVCRVAGKRKVTVISITAVSPTHTSSSVFPILSALALCRGGRINKSNLFHLRFYCRLFSTILYNLHISLVEMGMRIRQMKPKDIGDTSYWNLYRRHYPWLVLPSGGKVRLYQMVDKFGLQ